MRTSTRVRAMVAMLTPLWCCSLAPGADPPSIQEFQRAYRAAYDRQVTSTTSLKLAFRRDIATLPVPIKPGEEKPVAEKTKEQVEKEQMLERRIEAMNRMNKMDITYFRSRDRQRLDIKATHPEGKGEWDRSIVLAKDGSFAAHKMPEAREYILEYFERGVERAAGEFNQVLGFVNASRHVGGQETTELLLGNEFEITKLRVEQVPGADHLPIERLIVEVRRVKAPKASRIPRHLVRATLTLDPKCEYRLVHYVLESDDGNVFDGAIEYEKSSGPGALIPSKFVQDIRKEGVPHRRVETFTKKEVSFDKIPDEVFMKEAFGIGEAKPSESSLWPLIAAGLGLALIALGIFLYAARSRKSSLTTNHA